MSYISDAALATEVGNGEKGDLDKATKRLAAIRRQLDTLFQFTPRSPQILAIEVILGIEDGGSEKVGELLGLTASTASGPLAITADENTGGTKYGPDVRPHEKGMIMPLYDADGNKTHDSHFESHLIDQGYAPVVEGGIIMGYKPRVMIAPTASVPTQTTPAQADRFEVRDKNDKNVLRYVTHQEALADKTIVGVADPAKPGTFLRYKETPRVKLGR